MKSPLKSLLSILLVVALSLFTAWIYLRGRSLSQPVKEPVDHPFLAAFVPGKTVLIAHRGGWQERPENTFLAFEYSASLDPNLILWADVRPTKEGTLVAFRDRDLRSTTDGNGWISYTPDSEVEKLDAGYQFKDSAGNFPYRGQGVRVPRLSELLEKFPTRRWILNFHDNRPGMVEKVIEVVDAAKAGDRVLIASPEDGFLRDLREMKPTWIFGTSQAQVTRLKMIDSLALAPAVPLQGDVFVFEASDVRPSLYSLSTSVINEVHRRKLKIITGPIQDQDELQKLSSQGIDGVLISAPSKILGQATH